MRILTLTNNVWPPREGIGRHIAETTKGLVDRGHEVTVITRGEAYSDWFEHELGPVQVLAAPFWPIRPWHHQRTKMAINYWLAANRGRFDLIHVHLPLVPKIQTDLPMVLTVHSPMLTDTDAITETGFRAALTRINAKLFSQRLERWHLARARRIIAVSQSVRRELEAVYSVDPEAIEVISNGVDTDFFTPGPTIKRRHILYVGRLGYRKGLVDLLNAFARQAPRIEHDLRLVGEGPLEDDLLRLAIELGIEQRVHFSGFADRHGVRQALRTAAAYISPSTYEACPLTLFEAMATATPVISTRAGFVNDLAQAEGMMVLCDIGVDGLADAIGQMADRPGDMIERAHKARAWVRNHGSWDTVVDRLEVVLDPRKRLAA